MARVLRAATSARKARRAVAREVRTGLANDGWTEILGGLDADEGVVTEGQTQLRDGTPVQTL